MLPFTKLHGAENDFLLTWADQAPQHDPPEIARRICARTTGVGADGWMLISKEDHDGRSGLRTRLFNSDGSEPEISGNGTRCAAAFAVWTGINQGPEVPIWTAAGEKMLRLISRDSNRFLFEMNMGVPRTQQLRAVMRLRGAEYDATLLNVGNPQCALFVDTLPSDWRAAAQEPKDTSDFRTAATCPSCVWWTVTQLIASFTSEEQAKHGVPGQEVRVPVALLFSGK